MPSHDYWLERWRDQRIGFHEAAGNAGLQRHWPWRDRRVLVPLCGKAIDLRWLADRGNEVVGVELSETAIRDFFAEQELRYTIDEGPLTAFRAKELPLTIYCGDYFAFDGPRCDALYDRAALVALPTNERSAYVSHTNRLLQPGAAQLVITFCYDQQAVGGPPFAVADHEVREHWPELERVEAHNVIAQAPPKFRAAGLTEVLETIWRR